MRMYALYERSRKVLALYIIVIAVTLAVACVSLDFSGDQYLASHSIADSVVSSGQYWAEKKKNLGTFKWT
jgi:hypothetical protein